jgi:hypothetical protein
MAEGGKEKFIGEELKAVPGTFDAAAMARGEPGLPLRFTWRSTQYHVVAVIEKWKSTGPCRHGSDELYVRRHWFKIRTEPRAEMTVYCDRQAKERRRPKARWWIYSVAGGGPAEGGCAT